MMVGVIFVFCLVFGLMFRLGWFLFDGMLDILCSVQFHAWCFPDACLFWEFLFDA